jgi:hypothetical protein
VRKGLKKKIIIIIKRDVQGAKEINGGSGGGRAFEQQYVKKVSRQIEKSGHNSKMLF